MEGSDLVQISHDAVYVLIAISAPILILSLLVGLIISLFQALTQIQETTLTFVPKTLIIYVSLLFLSPYIISKLKDFTQNISEQIAKSGIS